jgi:hypothetical protein
MMSQGALSMKVPLRTASAMVPAKGIARLGL